MRARHRNSSVLTENGITSNIPMTLCLIITFKYHTPKMNKKKHNHNNYSTNTKSIRNNTRNNKYNNNNNNTKSIKSKNPSENT